MQDKTWYSILGLDAEPLFLQDHMLSHLPTLITSTFEKNRGIEPTTFQLGRNTPEGFWLLCSKNTLTYEICFFLHTKSIFQKGRIKHGLFKLIAPLCVIKFWFRLKFNCLIISCFYAFGRK